MKKEIDIPLSAIIYCLYLNRPERCRKRRIRGTRSMVHARSSNAAPLCHSVQYPDGLKLPAISEQNHRTACIPAHSGQRQRGFCSVKRLSVRLSDREQKLRRPACKRKKSHAGKPMFYLSLPTTSVRSLSQASSSTPSLGCPICRQLPC